MENISFQAVVTQVTAPQSSQGEGYAATIRMKVAKNVRESVQNAYDKFFGKNKPKIGNDTREGIINQSRSNDAEHTISVGENVCQLAIAKEFALPTALVTRGIGSKINKDLLAATMNHAIKDCVINVTISMHHAGEKFDDEDALKENAQVSAIEVVENLQPELSSRQMLLFKEAVADYKKAIETAKARSVSATASRFNISTEQGEKGEDMFGAEAGAEAGGIPATAQ